MERHVCPGIVVSETQHYTNQTNLVSLVQTENIEGAMKNEQFRDFDQTRKRMTTNKNTNQVLVKAKKFLLVIRHTPCYL